MQDPSDYPVSVSFETDYSVDDIACKMNSGAKVLVQAKRSLKLSVKEGTPFHDAWSQCVAAIEGGEVDPQSDRLVIATGSGTKPLRDLASALSRRRDAHSTSYNPAEIAALERLNPLETPLSPEVFESLLDALVIWECEAEDVSARDSTNARQMLDGHIVTLGSGHAALQALRSSARELAAKRSGFNVEGMVQSIRDSGVRLSRGGGNTSALRVADGLRVIADYRASVGDLGKRISLLGLGAGLPDLELEDVDARVQATEPSCPDRTGTKVSLELLIRRRGRLILTGLPGSGKSTALRSAAARQAEDPKAPVPIPMRLNDLAKLVASRGFLDGILDLATRPFPEVRRPQLREEIGGAIAEGDATLFFDGLDEVRTKRRELVRALSEFLAVQDASLEVIVSGRDVSVFDARALGFSEARLSPPEDVDKTIRAVLNAFARSKNVSDPPEWVQPRERWVDQILSRDSDLQETPLMPVLLSVSAASHDRPDTLPNHRADILQTVVRDVVDQWEVTRAGDLELGAISGVHASEALHSAFIAEGSALVDSSSRSAVQDKLERLFGSQWDLPAGPARATAVEAMRFWDETGFFLDEGDTISPRVRLFAELAEALEVGLLADGEKGTWIKKAIAGERSESLKLAAGSNQTVASALVIEAVKNKSPDLAFLACVARTEGANYTKAETVELALRLIDAVNQSGPDASKAANFLSDLPVEASVQALALSSFDASLSQKESLVARVNAKIAWNQPVDASLLQDFEDVFTMSPPKTKFVSDESVLTISLEVDPLQEFWNEAAAGSAEHLIPISRRFAELAAPHMSYMGMFGSRRIRAALREAGYTDIIRREDAKRHSDLQSTISHDRGFAELEEGYRVILRTIADLEVATNLSRRQARGIGNLADLFQTVGLPDAPAWHPTNLALREPSKLETLMRACSVLGGFDRGVLAGEAEQMLEEAASGFTNWECLVFLPGEKHTLNRWEEVEAPDTMVEELLNLLSSYSFAARRAGIGLANAPRSLRVHEKLLSRVKSLQGWNQQFAALVCLESSTENPPVQLAETWSVSENVHLREASASHGARNAPNHGDSEILRRSLADRDRSVRFAALRFLSTDVAHEIEDLVKKSESGSEGWTCQHCDHWNGGDATGCESCNAVGPDLAREIQRTLEGIDREGSKG